MQPPPQTIPKPKAFMILGILNLIIGIFTVGGLLMSLVMQMVPALREQDVTRKIIEQHSEFAIFHYVGMGLGGIMGVVVLLSGIGLLMSKNWGRTLGIVWAVYTLIYMPIGGWITYKYIWPATMEHTMQNTPGMDANAAKIAEMVMIVIGGGTMVLYVLYCLGAIYALSRGKMKAWCLTRGQPLPG